MPRVSYGWGKVEFAWHLLRVTGTIWAFLVVELHRNFPISLLRSFYEVSLGNGKCDIIGHLFPILFSFWKLESASLFS